MGKNKSLIGAIALFYMSLGTPLLSQEDINPLTHPGNRYSRQNIQSDIISHWQGPVRAQFLGISSLAVQQTLLAELFTLGQASRIDLEVNGFPNSMFDDLTLNRESRMVFLAYDGNSEGKMINGINADKNFGEIDFSEANEHVRDILNQGLVKQAVGCLARWSATEENVIEAIVIAVSDSVSDREKQVCFWNLLPTAFGVSNVVSLYNASIVIGSKRTEEEVVFADRSEIALQLSAAATCREELDDLSNACPFRLINGILRYHGEIAHSEEK